MTKKLRKWKAIDNVFERKNEKELMDLAIGCRLWQMIRDEECRLLKEEKQNEPKRTHGIK